MLLKLPQLSFFCALVETGSISAAAERMFTVPSNITARIKELEESLGASLVNREKQRLSITPEGRAFYQRALALLQQSQECQDFFKQQPLSGELRIGGLDVAMASHLQNSVANFMQIHSSVNLQLSCDSSLPLMDKLLAGQLDLIFVDGPIVHPTLDSFFFAPESLSLVTHLDDLLQFRQQVEKLTLLTFGKNCFYHLLIEQWLQQQLLNTRQVCAIESYPVILKIVHQGLGFTVMPQTLLQNNPQTKGLNIIPLSEIPSCDLYCVWRKFNQSAVIEAFLAELKQNPY